MTLLRVLDLFSGIGGFSLGLERTGGFKTVAFCEIEPFPRRVLAKHWPEVPCYDDVRTLTAERLCADGIAVDVICGGFPCQDISVAGKRVGIEGARSSLWSEIARLAGELRPRFVIVENVAALLGNGLDRVLGDLASLGFDAEWHCIPAAAIGAPHLRDRFWMVAYPNGERTHFEQVSLAKRNDQVQPNRNGSLRYVADSDREGLPLTRSFANGANGQLGWGMLAASRGWPTQSTMGGVAHGLSAATYGGLSAQARLEHQEGSATRGISDGGELRALRRDGRVATPSPGLLAADVGADTLPALSRDSGPRGRVQANEAAAGLRALRRRVHADAQQEAHALQSRMSLRNGQTACDETLGHWAVEPADTPRIAKGIKNRVARLRALGNAVVPQIPEMIGNAILASLAEQEAA